MLRKFLRDPRGSVLQIFAIALIPMLVATGGVIDYTNAFDQRSLVQDSLDAAALAAGKQVGLMTTDELKEEAESFFLANVGTTKITNIPELATTITGSTVDVNTTLHVPTYFLGLIGLSEFVFQLHTQVTVAMGTIEIAMALDNSGSMSGSRIETLRTAAANLATTLHALGSTSTKPDPVKIALAPFAAAVNVGPGYATADWMDTAADGTYHADAQKCYAAGGTVNSSGACNVSTGSTINNLTLFDSLKDSSGNAITWGGCVEERPMPYAVSDEPPSDAANPSTEEKKTLFVPMFAADDPDPWTCTTSTCANSGSGSSTRRYNGVRTTGTPGPGFNNYLPDAGDATTCGLDNVFTVTLANPAVFARTGHGLSVDTELQLLTTGSLPTGLSTGTSYYVASTTSDTFRLSTMEATQTFTSTIASPAVLTRSSHGLSTGTAITLTTTGSLPTGLSTNTDYYVAGVPSSSTFRLSASIGSTASISNTNPTVVTNNGHGLSAGSPVEFVSTGSLPSGVSAGTVYYVATSGLGSDSFRLSPTNSTPVVTITTGSPANFSSSSHGLTANTPLVFSTTGSFPSGITAGTTYYVISSGLGTNSFRVSATAGGGAINASGGQSGTHRFQRLVRTTSNGSGTHSMWKLITTSGSQSGTHRFRSLVGTSGSQSGAHSYTVINDWTCQSGSADCNGTGNGRSFEQAFGGVNVPSAPQCKYGTPANKATVSSLSVGGIPGGPNFMCTTTAATPLTPSLETITDAINAQQASGATNITAGLMWGWRVLSPGEPFTDGRSYADNENQKILVLMTDGANTYYPKSDSNQSITKSWYGAWGYVAMGHLGTTSTTTSTLVTEMNARTAAACTNAKAAGIKIYTIAFDVSDSATLEMLETCATETTMAFQSTSESELLAAFSAIGDDISLLRIAQ